MNVEQLSLHTDCAAVLQDLYLRGVVIEILELCLWGQVEVVGLVFVHGNSEKMTTTMLRGRVSSQTITGWCLLGGSAQQPGELA
ncbi:hypothetical protein KC19_2G146100 [Ceratodon purpureus]|uniref:Uncharacterized protein n=1 Tax=Ceratodon purpureus TaxID=3225 RepID=A0A8T0IWX8_CERPU|nr:hypothetical protein KC19_2G146100 [Ceratodon purpureus]